MIKSYYIIELRLETMCQENQKPINDKKTMLFASSDHKHSRIHCMLTLSELSVKNTDITSLIYITLHRQ